MSLQDSQDWLAIALRSGRETLGHGVSQRRLKKRRAWARAESIRPLPIASPRRGLAILSVVWPIADLRRPYEVSLSPGNIMRGRTGRGKVFHLATICLPIGRLINCRAAEATTSSTKPGCNARNGLTDTARLYRMERIDPLTICGTTAAMGLHSACTVVTGVVSTSLP